MNIGIFEDAQVWNLLPLVWLRSAFELRCGRTELIDKMRWYLGSEVRGVWLRDGVADVVTARTRMVEPDPNADWLLLNAALLVTERVEPPKPYEYWAFNGRILGVCLPAAEVAGLESEHFLDEVRIRTWLRTLKRVEAPASLRLVQFPWDLIERNHATLMRELDHGGEHLGHIHDGVHLVNSGNIYVAQGAVVKPGVVIDAEDGPVMVDRDARIEANAVISGPCYIGRGSVIRPGSVIREDTSIGPVCKVGGEVEASIFQGYANKQHDGFLGHSFVGSWVNLGADTVTSDLKNTYGSIRVNLNGIGVETGQRFLGSIIGDHAKTGICTRLPTGCIIGVAANIFTRGAVPKNVPSFAWLTDDGLESYRIDKAIDIARIVMGRRDIELEEPERSLIEQVAARAREVEEDLWSPQ